MEISADDYKRFAAKLKTADRAVARGIRKRIRDAAGPIGRIIIETGSEGMPSRGGLRARLMASRPQVGMAGSMASINLRKGANFASLNRGVLRHPLFGNRGRWYAQDVPAGAYTAALANLPPGARDNLTRVMVDVMKELDL